MLTEYLYTDAAVGGGGGHEPGEIAKRELCVVHTLSWRHQEDLDDNTYLTNWAIA